MADNDKKQPELDTSILQQQLDEQGKQRAQEDVINSNNVDDSLQHRSNNSVVKGGVNEQIGEPNPGYGTVAPGIQNGGKR